MKPHFLRLFSPVSAAYVATVHRQLIQKLGSLLFRRLHVVVQVRSIGKHDQISLRFETSFPVVVVVVLMYYYYSPILPRVLAAFEF